MISAALLTAIGATRERAEAFAPALDRWLPVYGIDTPQRLAFFLAQVFHESGALRHVREVWGPTAAQRTYEGRANLGNTQPGDGERFKGRGLIQTTGRANHARLRDRLRARGIDTPDFEAEPERLEELPWSVLSAADYWDMRSINTAADAGDFERATRLVNGGVNGLADRQKYLARAQAALQAPIAPELPTPQPAPTPAPRRSDPIPIDPINAPQGEPMHPAIIPIAIEALKGIVPKLGDLFAGSDTAKRNVQAAQAVIETASAAIGARNAQELIETVQADPKAAAEVKAAIEADWFKVVEATEKSVAAAREFSVQVAESGAKPWDLPAFWVSGALLIPLYAVVGSVLWIPSYDKDLRLQVITAVLAVIGLVGAFWLGSSRDSQRKTEIMAAPKS
jgi:putative chitinase